MTPCTGHHKGPPIPATSEGGGTYCGSCGWRFHVMCEPEPDPQVPPPSAPAGATSVTTLRRILDGVVLAPSGAKLDGLEWQIEIDSRGWLIRATFLRPDRETGEVSRGAGRWELVAGDASATSVVKTAWLCCELLVRHELMESFTYRGVRIFDPHHTVDELSMAHHARGPR